MNRKEEAAECYRKAIEIDPKKTSAHYNLGLVIEANPKKLITQNIGNTLFVINRKV